MSGVRVCVSVGVVLRVTVRATERVCVCVSVGVVLRVTVRATGRVCVCMCACMYVYYVCMYYVYLCMCVCVTESMKWRLQNNTPFHEALNNPDMLQQNTRNAAGRRCAAALSALSALSSCWPTLLWSVKVNIKVTLKQVTNIRRGVDVYLHFFFNIGSRRNLVVNATLRPLYPH